MPFVPSPSVAKVALEFNWAGQNVATIWHCKHSAFPALADLNNLATHFGTTYWNSFLTSCGTNIALVRVLATDLSSPSAPQGSYVPAAPVAGTGAGGSVPLNVCWNFTKLTALRGRNYRGRLYMPGLLQSIVTAPGQGNLSTLGGIAAVILNRVTTMMIANWAAGVLSQFILGGPRPSGVFTPLTAVSTNDAIDSQRRRLIGRGS